MTTESNKSAGSLLTEALSHVSSLMRKEVDLARAEVNENLKHAGVAIGLIVGAVVVALTALNVLSANLGPNGVLLDRSSRHRRLCDGPERHQ